MPKVKSLSYRELLAFCLLVPEEFLDKPAFVEMDEKICNILDAGFLSQNFYWDGFDWESTMDQESYDRLTEAEKEEYVVKALKGSPFLSDEESSISFLDEGESIRPYQPNHPLAIANTRMLQDMFKAFHFVMTNRSLAELMNYAPKNPGFAEGGVINKVSDQYFAEYSKSRSNASILQSMKDQGFLFTPEGKPIIADKDGNVIDPDLIHISMDIANGLYLGHEARIRDGKIEEVSVVKRKN